MGELEIDIISMFDEGEAENNVGKLSKLLNNDSSKIKPIPEKPYWAIQSGKRYGVFSLKPGEDDTHPQITLQAVSIDNKTFKVPDRPVVGSVNDTYKKKGDPLGWIIDNDFGPLYTAIANFNPKQK